MTTATASSTVSRLFGTVAVTADLVSSSITSVGTVVEALNTKSNAWLRDVQASTIASEAISLREIRHNVAARAVDLSTDIERITSSASAKQAYLAALAEIDAKLEAAGLK